MKRPTGYLTRTLKEIRQDYELEKNTINDAGYVECDVSE